MPYRAWAVPPQRAGPHPSPQPDDDVPDPGYDRDVGALGQQIAARLFIAGLDLDSALTLIADGPVADRLQAAIGELDGAIRDLRHLLLALPGLASGASRTASAADDITAGRPDPARPANRRDGNR
jgi:hypothetical protein